jgi:hypothetical protein
MSFQEDTATSNENGHAPNGTGHSSKPAELKTVDQIVDEAVAKHHEATKNEAGRPEGRLVPALVLGPQRYPDPSIYDPEGVTKSLTVDEDYGDTVEFLLDVARDTSISD